MVGRSTVKSIRPVKSPLVKSKAGCASATRGRKIDAASAASILVLKIFPNRSSLELMPRLIRPLAENIAALKRAATAFEAVLVHCEWPQLPRASRQQRHHQRFGGRVHQHCAQLSQRRPGDDGIRATGNGGIAPKSEIAADGRPSSSLAVDVSASQDASPTMQSSDGTTTKGGKRQRPGGWFRHRSAAYGNGRSHEGIGSSASGNPRCREFQGMGKCCIQLSMEAPLGFHIAASENFKPSENFDSIEKKNRRKQSVQGYGGSNPSNSLGYIFQ